MYTNDASIGVFSVHCTVYQATVDEGNVITAFLLLMSINVLFAIIASAFIVIEVSQLSDHTRAPLTIHRGAIAQVPRTLYVNTSSYYSNWKVLHAPRMCVIYRVLVSIHVRVGLGPR